MNLIGAFFVLVLPSFFTAYIVAPLTHPRSRAWFFSCGVVVGLPIFAALNLILAWNGRISWARIFFSLGLLGASAFFSKKKLGVSIPKDASTTIHKIALGVAALFFWLVMDQVMHVRKDGLYIGFEKNLGDLPFHLHLASSFLFADNIPPGNPIFSGLPLRYPYLSDFYSALLWFASGDMEMAFELPGFVLGLALVVILYHLVFRLTHIVWAACLAPVLFIFSGGAGFIYWIKDHFFSTENLQSRSYTIFGERGLEWANMIYALWIPQRSLQFAFPLLLFFLFALLENYRELQVKKLVLLGVLAMPLPFLHGHAIIILFIWTAAIFILRPSWKWSAFAIPIGLAWVPSVLFLSGKVGKVETGGPQFLHLNIGWMSDGLNIPIFWLKNMGLFLPLVFISCVWFYRNRQTFEKFSEMVALTLASFFIFLLGNVVVFAPWDWDNIKILVFAFLGLIPVCAAFIGFHLSRRPWFEVMASGVAVMILIFSGFLDISKALKKNQEDHRLFTTGEMTAAESLKKLIAKNATLLLRPTYNQPFVLTGRSFFLGYEGHIWSHGLPLDPRRNELLAIAKGENVSERVKRHHIDYLVIGRREEDLGFKKDAFRSLYPEVQGITGEDYNATPFSVFRVSE